MIENTLPIDTIIHGDCRDILRTLPDECIDAVARRIDLTKGSLSNIALTLLEGGIFTDTLSAAKRLLTILKPVCPCLKLLCTDRTYNQNTSSAVPISAFIRTKKLTSLRDLYPPRLLSAKFPTVSTWKRDCFSLVFVRHIAFTRTICLNTIILHEWLVTMSAALSVFFNGSRTMASDHFILSSLPFQLTCTGKRTALIAFDLNKLSTYFAWIIRNFGNKRSRCARHGQSAMQCRIEERIRQLYPIVLRTPYMTIMATSHKISENISCINIQPISLWNEMMSNKIISSSTISTNLIASNNSTGDSSPRFALVRPSSTTPRRITSTTQAYLVIFCHTLSATILLTSLCYKAFFAIWTILYDTLSFRLIAMSFAWSQGKLLKSRYFMVSKFRGLCTQSVKIKCVLNQVLRYTCIHDRPPMSVVKALVVLRALPKHNNIYASDYTINPPVKQLQGVLTW